MMQQVLSAEVASLDPGGAIRLDGVTLEDADRLAERLIGFALARQLRLATAESCTAGLIAHRLSRSSGSAAVLAGGIVTYTKDAKMRMLGVSRELFGPAGAVDAEVAKAMARGALARSGADCAISVTGVTGGEPDEDGNPIGRVFTGFAMGETVKVLHCELGLLSPQALTHLAMQATFLLALAELGDAHAAELLSSAPRVCGGTK